MTLFSYRVKRDHGFAPNPFWGYCTLATCKPDIRKQAKVGDWIVGTGTVSMEIDEPPGNLENNIIYVMKVSEILTFDEYWEDSRFESKKPVLNGSRVQLYGDNIYHHDSKTGEWIQEDSHHSLEGGEQNNRNLERDTSSTNVPISEDFYYWGRKAVEVPEEFRDSTDTYKNLCHSTQGFKKNFEPDFVDKFIKWLEKYQSSASTISEYIEELSEEEFLKDNPEWKGELEKDRQFEKLEDLTDLTRARIYGYPFAFETEKTTLRPLNETPAPEINFDE